MNEFNNNETNENIMDIPVAPPAKANKESEEAVAGSESLESETITTETPEVKEEQPIEANEMAGEESQSLSAESQTIGNINNESSVEVTQISPSQTPVESNSDIIPDTLDLNYGVIPPNNSETVIKQNSTKNNTKIIVGIVVGVLVVILLVIGFLAYKFYFAVDPVKTVTSKIRELGQSADEMYSNSATMTLLKNNDKLSYSGDLSANIDLMGEKYSLDYGYNMALLKSDNKLNANVHANLNESSLLNMNATIFKSALFIKALEEGHNFRVNTDATGFFEDLETEINNIANSKIFETYADYLATAIENNISKKDFEISTAKTNVDGKEVLSNKYSLNLTPEMFNGILADLMESLKNDETFGAELKDFNTNNIETDFEELKINIYVSLKGVIKIEILPETGIITYTKITDEHSVFTANDGLIDIIVMDIYTKKEKSTIDLTMDFEGTKLIASLEIGEDGNIKGNFEIAGVKAILDCTTNITEESDKIATNTTMKVTVSAPDLMPNDIIVDINYKMNAEVNNDLTIPMPSGAINVETEEGQALFESEFKQTGLYSLLEQFLVSDDLMNSASDNADDWEENDAYYNETFL